MRYAKIDFWEFLNSSIQSQLNLACLWILKQNGWIKKESFFKENIEFKTFNTSSIEETITKHAIAFINEFGEEPALILVGMDVHDQILNSPSIRYQMNYQYGWRRVINVAGIQVSLLSTIEGFVLLSKNDLEQIRHEQSRD